MPSTIAPIFKALYSSNSLGTLRDLLSTTEKISLSDTLTLHADSNSWSVSPEPPKGLFSVKVSEVLDTSKAYLSFGGLRTDENQFTPENILKHMQNTVHGREEGMKNADYNKIALQLLQMLPEEDVSRLLGQGDGASLVEMPFVTPFPIEGEEGKFTPARMGLLFDTKVPSVNIVFRPISSDNYKALTISTPAALSKDEINAAQRRYADPKTGTFQLPGLSHGNSSTGKDLITAPLEFAYCARSQYGRDHLHNRTMTIGSGGKLLNLALINHKELQTIFMKSIALRGEKPWTDRDHMMRELSLLPEVSARVRAGASPVVAIKAEIESNEMNLKEPYGPRSKLSLDHEFKAMIDAGYDLLAKNAIPNHPFIQQESPSPSP